MAAGKSELAKHIASWLASLSQAMDHESWGQPVEASELYRKLGKTIRNILTSGVQINDPVKRELTKFSANLEHRAQLTADPTNILDGSQLADMKSFLEDLQAGKEATCQIITNSPVKLQPRMEIDNLNVDKESDSFVCELVIDGDDDDGIDGDQDGAAHDTLGNLLPQPLYKPGQTYLVIHISKIGIKDPHNYIDPFIEISIKDSVTNNCEAIQRTPVSHCREITYFVFDVDIHIQTAIEDMPAGAAIFFELKHYKPKKERVSTRCFSFMELDEIRDGPVSLEIYKKPTDFRKKKLFLLSVKPLYLHLKLLLNKPLLR